MTCMEEGEYAQCLYCNSIKRKCKHFKLVRGIEVQSNMQCTDELLKSLPLIFLKQIYKSIYKTSTISNCSIKNIGIMSCRYMKCIVMGH